MLNIKPLKSMKNPFLKIAIYCLMAGITCFSFSSANAQQHDGYVHALKKLRAAHWLLDHRPGNWQQSADEQQAESFIEAAVTEIKAASVEDGKGWADRPDNFQDIQDRTGRLREAVNLLRSAKQDVLTEPDVNNGYRARRHAIKQLDAAITAIGRAFAERR
jgi:hypothetical protein